MSWMVDFLTVVIGCGVARSKDDWTNMLNTQRSDCLRHHYCLHDRKVVASFLVDAGIAGDLVYDTPSNDAERQYAAMPERIYVIYKRFIVYDSRRGGAHGGYKVQRLYVYLWKLYRNVKTKDARRSAKERKRIKDISTEFKHDDPRNPNNVKTQDPWPDREDESGSGVSGLSVVVGNDSSLNKSPGPSILKNKSSGADSISSESMSTTDAFSAFTGESSMATDADSSSDSANSPAASK